MILDNSGSMQFHNQDDQRIDDLRVVFTRTVSVATMFDDDGISIRFMNDFGPYAELREDRYAALDKITTEQRANDLISTTDFSGATPMGENLREKILLPFIGKARSGSLEKPILVITITDGRPTDHPQNDIRAVIKSATEELARLQYSPGVLALQFAQVGLDSGAMEFLAQLDNDPQVGSLIDCTSSGFLSINKYGTLAKVAYVQAMRRKQ